MDDKTVHCFGRDDVRLGGEKTGNDEGNSNGNDKATAATATTKQRQPTASVTCDCVARLVFVGVVALFDDGGGAEDVEGDGVTACGLESDAGG